MTLVAEEGGPVCLINEEESTADDFRGLGKATGADGILFYLHQESILGALSQGVLSSNVCLKTSPLAGVESGLWEGS